MNTNDLERAITVTESHLADLRAALTALARAAHGDSNDDEIQAGHDLASLVEQIMPADYPPVPDDEYLDEAGFLKEED